MLLNLTDYHSPSSIDQALGLLDATVRPLAGGTGLVASQDSALTGVVDLRGLGLDACEIKPDDALVLGATVRLADLPAVEELDTLHGRTLLEAAHTSWPSLGKRHLSTLGGRLWQADQRSLLGALMIALEARYVLAGPEGERTVAAEAFHAAPRPADSLLTRVEIPPAPPGSLTVLETVRAIPTAMPIVGVAVRLQILGGQVGGFRAAVGPGAAAPTLIEGMEQQMVGEPVSEFPRHALRAGLPEQFPLIEDSRGSALYRRRMVPVLLERAVDRIIEASAS